MNRISTGAAPMGVAPGGVSEHRGLLRFAPYTDRLAMFGWVALTSFPTEWAAPIRYLVVAYFAAGAVLFARQVVPTFARAWPCFLLPILAIVSMAWAPSVSEAVRKGVLTGLAATVAIYAASRLSSRHILMAYFFGELIGATLSVVTPNPTSFGAWTGVFGQKNFLAGHMFIFYAAALALLLDKKSKPWLRLTTLIGAAMGALLIFMSQSATTLILMVVATFALVMHAVLWQTALHIRHMRTLIVLAIAVLGASACLLLFGLFQVDAWDSLLASMGKDSTLTGRTFLWQIADRIMAEHPWTGLGVNGFWRPELGAANEITRYFHYEAFTKFSFHNSYRENGVQLGYPGFYATVFLAGWGLISAAIIWLRNQTIANATFLVLAVLVVIRSNTETDLAGELGATMILFFIAALRGREPSSDHHPAGASLPPSSQSPRPAR